jgi:hypothetical protein
MWCDWHQHDFWRCAAALVGEHRYTAKIADTYDFFGGRYDRACPVGDVARASQLDRRTGGSQWRGGLVETYECGSGLCGADGIVVFTSIALIPSIPPHRGRRSGNSKAGEARARRTYASDHPATDCTIKIDCSQT